MEHSLVFLKARAIAFCVTALVAFIWSVLLVVFLSLQWTDLGNMARSFIAGFLAMDIFTVFILLVLLLCDFRPWLDGARMGFLLAFHIGIAAAFAIAFNSMTCKSADVDGPGYCQLYNALILMSSWAVPALLFFYTLCLAWYMYRLKHLTVSSIASSSSSSVDSLDSTSSNVKKPIATTTAATMTDRSRPFYVYTSSNDARQSARTLSLPLQTPPQSARTSRQRSVIAIPTTTAIATTQPWPPPREYAPHRASQHPPISARSASMPRSLLTAPPPGARRVSANPLSMHQTDMQRSLQQQQHQQSPMMLLPGQQRRQRPRTMPAPLVLHNGDRVLSGTDLLASGGASGGRGRRLSAGPGRSPRRASAGAHVRAKSDVQYLFEGSRDTKLPASLPPTPVVQSSSRMYAPGAPQLKRIERQGHEQQQQQIRPLPMTTAVTSHAIGAHTGDQSNNSLKHTERVRPDTTQPAATTKTATWSRANVPLQVPLLPPRSDDGDGDGNEDGDVAPRRRRSPAGDAVYGNVLVGVAL